MNKNNWTYKKLGEVATFSRGLTYSKQDVAEDSSKKVLRSNNIDLTTHSLNLDDIVCLNEEFVIPVDKKFKQNDIFICMSNGSKQHLGKVAFIEKELDYAFGGFMGAIHPKTSEIFPKFAFYFCLSSEYRRSLATVLNGININNIKWSDLSKFPIPIPPLAEQERIVAELDLLSSIIEKKKAQLKELDQLAQSIFYDMFGDPITNEKGWDVKKLSDICEKITDGTHDTPKRLDVGVKFITGKHIRPFFIDYDNSDYVAEEVHNEIYKRCNPEYGDVLYTNIGAGIGNAALNVVEYEFSMKNVALLKLKKNNIIGFFVVHFLNDDKMKSNIIENHSNGGAQRFLSLKAISKIRIILPPLPLQQEFAEKVEAIERQKSLIQQSIDEVQTLFDSRMDYWFG